MNLIYILLIALGAYMSIALIMYLKYRPEEDITEDAIFIRRPDFLRCGYTIYKYLPKIKLEKLCRKHLFGRKTISAAFGTGVYRIDISFPANWRGVKSYAREGEIVCLEKVWNRKAWIPLKKCENRFNQAAVELNNARRRLVTL